MVAAGRPTKRTKRRRRGASGEKTEPRRRGRPVSTRRLRANASCSTWRSLPQCASRCASSARTSPRYSTLSRQIKVWRLASQEILQVLRESRAAPADASDLSRHVGPSLIAISRLKFDDHYLVSQGEIFARWRGYSALDLTMDAARGLRRSASERLDQGGGFSNGSLHVERHPIKVLDLRAKARIR